MDGITLAWTEAGQRKTQTVDIFGSTKAPWTIRVGRDPAQCDVVLPSLTESDRTVSRLHIEIVFNPAHCSFYLRNLKPNNPVRVDGRGVATNEVVLHQGSTIRLGEIEVEVESVSVVPATVVAFGGQSRTAVLDSMPQKSQDSTPPAVERISSQEPIASTLHKPIAATTRKPASDSTELAPLPKKTLPQVSGLQATVSQVAKRLGSSSKPTLSRQALFKSVRLVIGIGIIATLGSWLWQRSQTITSHKAFVNGRIIPVRAPIAGELRLQNISPGQQIQAGTPLGNIFNPRNSELQIAQQNLSSELENLTLQQERLQAQLVDRRISLQQFEQEAAAQQSLQSAFQQQLVERVQWELQESIQAAELAEMEAARVLRLAEEGAVSQQDVDRAVAEKDQTQTLVRSRRAQLAQARLEATASERGLQLNGSRTLSFAEIRRREVQSEIADLELERQSLASQIEQKQSELNTIAEQLQLQRSATILSPSDGAIWSIDYQPDTFGTVVATGDPIAHIANCNNVWVEAFVSERDAEHLFVGAQATVRFLGNLRRESLAGAVQGIRSGVGRVETGQDVAIPPEGLTRRQVSVRVNIDSDPNFEAAEFCAIGRSAEVRFPRSPSSTR